MADQDQKPHTIITGAAGFIGFHLARHFQKAGYNPLCLDRQAAFPDGDIRNRRLSKLKQAGCRVAFGDLAASDFVDATFAAEKPQLLLHMAARTNARGDDWAMYDRDNVQPVHHLLSAAHQHGLRHFVFASSSAVYGGDAPTPFSEEMSLTAAETPYEKTKQIGEAIIQEATAQHQLGATIIRFFNVYGPWGRPDMAPYIFADRIRDDQPVTLYNGDTERAWLYIDDAVRACFDLANMPPANGESPQIVNVAGPDPIRTLDLLHMIAGKSYKTPQINHEAAAVREVISSFGSVERLRGLTKAVPQTSFEEGISKFLLWHQENQGQEAT